MNQLENLTTSPLAQPGRKEQWQDGVNVRGSPCCPISPPLPRSVTFQEGNSFTPWLLGQGVLDILSPVGDYPLTLEQHVQHVGKVG